MKTYIDHGHRINYKNLWIPKNVANRFYNIFLEEQAKGEAELVPYIPPVPTWEQIRSERDWLLKETDWAVLPDASPKPSKQAWLNYRQALRDVPQNFATPQDVVWPQKP